MRWPTPLPTPTLSGDTATYQDVVAGGDLVVKALTTGYEVSLVLRQRPADAAVIRLPLSLEGLRLAQQAGGRLSLTNAAGAEVAASPPPIMTSAARDPRADEPTQTRIIPTTVETGKAGPELVLRPDAAFLADPATVYPVTIDPAGTLGSNLSTYVASDYPNQNYDGDTLLKVGTYNGGATVDRSYIRFDDSAIKGLQVTNATLNLYETWSYSCSPSAMWVDGAFGPPNGLQPGATWNNQPQRDGRHWGNASFYGGYSGCPGTAGWKAIEITGLGQGWSSNGAPSPEALALLAPNEADSYQWKKFASVNTSTPPYIAVTYNSPATPSAPLNVSATAGNASAVVNWSPPASGGSSPIDAYVITAYTYPQSVYLGYLVACGTCTSAAVPGLANGQGYVFGVYAHNPIGYGPGVATNIVTPAAPPGPPQAVVATSANSGATLRWAPPPANSGGPVEAYLVYAYNFDGSPRSYQFVDPATTSVIFGGLDNGGQYRLAVFAYNAPGGYGAGTNSNNVFPAAADPMAGAGERSFFTYDRFTLTDTMAGAVNIGTGNLEVTVTDVALPALSGAMSLGRTYNSMAPAQGASDGFSTAFGWDWRFSGPPDTRLVVAADASVAYDAPSGNVATFAPSGSSYVTPPGFDATLVRNGDASFTLTAHASAEVSRFAPDGNLVSVTDRNGNAQTFSYFDGRRVGSITSTAGTAPGNTATINYGGTNGRVSSITRTADGVTRTVSYAYNSDGSGITSVTDATGGVTYYGYDAASNLAQITDAAGRVSTFGYDAAHRLTSLSRIIPGAPSAVTRYDYTTPGHTKLTDADGHPVTDYTVDPSGRVIRVTDAKGASRATTYTADAKVGSVTNAMGGVTTNTYGANAGESLTQSTGPTGASVTASYNAPGQPYLADSVNDTMGNRSTFTYAGPGNLSAAANAMAATARLSYNPDGTVATATDPGGGMTTYSYNPARQLVTLTPPSGTTLGAQRFTYDGAGRLRSAVSGAGMTTTYSYDAADRRTAETHSDGTATVSSAYDAAGNLTSRTDATGTTTYAYDVANHVIRKTVPGGAVLSYTYDPVGNLLTATDASGTTAYRYDKVNRLDQVTEPGGRTDVFAYDADGRRSDTWGATNGGATYDASGNNLIPPTGFAIHIRASFDPAGQLTQLRTTRASSNADAFRVADLTYAYTVPAGTTCAGASAGRATALRQSVTDNLSGALTAYCYDGGARLTTAATGGGTTYAYGYDPNGPRTSGPEGAHAFNAANQATDAASAYDATGNLTASVAFPALAYNGLGQATSITASGQGALALAYAGTTNAERTAAGPTTFQNGLLGVQSQAAGGTTTSFVRDPQGGLIAERIGTEEYYYAFDGLGSVIALVDATGTQRAAYSYDPYGGHASATAMNGP